MKKIDPSLKNRSGLDRGIFRVRSDLSFSPFSQNVRAGKPIFTRHIQPIDEIQEIDRTKEDFLRFIEMQNKLISTVSPGTKIAIQVRRVGGLDFGYTTYGVKEALDPFLLEKGAVPVVQNPDIVMSIFLTGSQAYFGMSTPIENLSDWPGGAVRFRREENQASRSRFKLEEACVVFGIQLSAYNRALDLGAAPGGWTSFLLDQGLQVTAVDTGAMNPELLENPNLEFVKANTAEVFFEEDSFDMMTCDMSWDPLHTAKIVNRLAPCLRKDGVLVVTIKLMHKKIFKTVEEFVRILEPEFEKIQVKQLFHNRDEVTAYLIKK
ncbi:SAM-dependent methyltransferase [Effusibacillus consociatus]|uniref:SAM-dependent methyltransferase n=1 Tax=Effusibacillus consociatus TaxID=1117041 RepID=A0ABV9Q180_9BACL